MYEVTQEEYQRVMGANPSEFSATGKEKDKVGGQDTKRFPVENVSWDDAVEFCRKLSEYAGGEGGGADGIVCLRRRSGSMHAARGARVGTVSVRASSGIPKESEEQRACLTTGGSTAIPAG